jgi:hypothetical protein
MLVPVGGVVGAGDYNPSHPGIIGGPVDVIGHRHIYLLIVEVIQGYPSAALVAQVHYCIHSLEVMGVFAKVGAAQVGDGYIRHRVTGPVHIFYVHQSQVVLLTKSRYKLGSDISTGAS